MINYDYNLLISSTGTFSRSEYSADRYIKSGGNTVIIIGNLLPYAAGFLLRNSIEIISPVGFSLQLSVSITGEQFTDVFITETPSANGEKGIMESFTIFDFTAAVGFVPPTNRHAEFGI